MPIQENISLRSFNSFHIDALARYFAPFSTVEELADIVAQQGKTQRWILGGGTNILLSGNLDGLVLKNEIKGFDVVHEDDDYVYVRAGAGESWHQFVLDCIANNRGGVENLSLIPGNVGSSPIQNIGAYGVEIKDVFHELKAWHLQEKCNYTFSLKDCGFGYRESVFKGKYKGQFVILSVTYRLRKKPIIDTSYGAIVQELEKMGVVQPGIADVSNAVIRIRSSKLPDPMAIGNAGSFFKNPSVSREQYEVLKESYPAMVAYANADGSMKLAAGWMIEYCGWKGYRKGDAGCHEKQALVLVNYGHATGQNILDLSTAIQQSVMEKFGVVLEQEVNIF